MGVYSVRFRVELEGRVAEGRRQGPGNPMSCRFGTQFVESQRRACGTIPEDVGDVIVGEQLRASRMYCLEW